MNKYKLTVSVETYNQEKYIKQCLDGILMQKVNFPFQVIISDDCSTDNTRNILSDYQKKYPDIIKPIFREKNLGPMDNFIETLNSIHTEYVALCDGDDYWTDPDKLQSQVDFLDNHKDYNICFHQTEVFFQDGSREEEVAPTNMKETTEFDDLVKECYIPANTVVYRWKFLKKDSFKKIFPRNVVPGDYFVHLCHAQDGKIKFIEKPMSRYRRHNEGMWWLSSQPDRQDEFHLKYGYKYLNFFKAVENQFDLSSDTYLVQKRYLIYQTAKSYLKNRRWEDLAILEKENPEIFNEYFNTITIDPVYENMSKMKKFFYLLLVDRRTLFQKISDKLEKRPLLFKIYRLLLKYKEIILYGIFGVLTTLVNILVYFLFTRLFHIGTYASNVIAWILSVLFAFFTNKSIVFRSRDRSRKTIIRECSSFFGFRLLSLVFDMGLMFFMIDICHIGDMFSKIVTNIVVIILNYIFSKLFVFRKKELKG